MADLKESKFFNVFQFDLEEDYLEEKHRRGFAFKDIDWLLNHRFEKVPPREMTYKLEFSALIDDMEAYKQHMADFGWEYIGNHLQYSYFKRPASLGGDDFYTDYESKKNHLHKIIIGRILATLLFYYFFALVGGFDDFFSWNFFASIIVLPIILNLILGKDYRRLLRKYKAEGGDGYE